jgi:hypothetical protein
LIVVILLKLKPIRFMKSIVYYIALAFLLGACSTGRYVVKGDEYDDVYLVSSDFQKAEIRKERKITESGGLPSEAFNSEYDQKPISNYANPDAMDLPVGSNPNGVVYYPMNNQNANWNNYNSWNNIGWNDCWNCWGGGGWNTWNSPYYYNTWNTPYYYNSWSRPWGWNSWNNGWSIGIGYGWNTWNTFYYYNSWNRPWGWNSWNNGWGWGGNTIIIDNRTPSKIQVAPRASAGRGSSFIRNIPNPRLQNNELANPSTSDQQSGRIANTTGGRTRNIANNTYTPTQSNEIRTGRIRNENTNNSERYSTPSDSRGRDNSGSFSGGRNSNNNNNSWGSLGRGNDNSGSYGSGRSNSNSRGLFSSGSSGGRVGGRSPR